MKNYRHAHLWLLIPGAIAILGFLPSYWLRFAEAPWRQHLHGLTATLWFIMLVTQPYLITRGHARQHRLFGIIAVFVAGGVAFSALSIIPFNFKSEFLPEVAKYGLSFVDMILVPGFIISVLMAVKTAQRVDDHASWMVSTVFWVISPGLFRVFLIPIIATKQPNVDALIPWALAATGIANILVLAWLMFRARRAHPAYVFASVGSLVMLLPMTAGNWQWWRALADSMFAM